MATEAQKQANRRNALKSTGPRSAEGKATARQNATKHALLTQNLIVRDESPVELESFRERIYEALCPQGAMEELLVEKIINAAWRLRRLTKVESETLERDTFFGSSSTTSVFHEECNTLLTISRYESSLERNFYKAIHELQRLQAMRLGHAVLAPIAIEVSNSSDEFGFVSQNL